jgi:hypothetical protein
MQRFFVQDKLMKVHPTLQLESQTFEHITSVVVPILQGNIKGFFCMLGSRCGYA